jgi:glucose/arabinose dehydrogenase
VVAVAGFGVAALAAAAALVACSARKEAPQPTLSGISTTVQAPAVSESASDFPSARRIDVPRGFRAEVYAGGLKHPTAMAWGPDGLLYVSQDVGNVVTLRPLSKRPRLFLDALETPLGLAWQGRKLFVSARGRLEVVRLDGRRAAARKTVVSNLPYGLHQQDNVLVGRDGRVYLGSGSTCDACAEDDPRSATILSMLPSGRDLRIVATGLRNPFGLAFEPETGRLYASVNGRDDLPDPESREPAEMLVAVKRGADYGWPRCWPSALRRRLEGACAGVTPPVAYLEAHSGAGGIAFATGPSFPPRYREGVFVALWGQYASHEHGRRVDFVSLRAGGASPRGRVERFADGFGHPLALAFDPQGALLVADWGSGTIYRIQASRAP